MNEETKELNINRFIEVISDVQKKLEDDQLTNNWEEKYSQYAKTLLEYQDSKIYLGKKFHKSNPFGYYMSVENIKHSKNTLYVSMRYLGQIVADITVKNDEVYINTKQHDKTNERDFGCKLCANGKWNSKEASNFRRYFRNEKPKKKHNQEHKIESALLEEFSKVSSSNKSICNIQPIKYAGFRFPMLSEISASNHENLHARTTNIDIFARVNKRLTVFELKDQYKSNKGKNEGPQKVLEQATAYATFILKLLHSKSGKEWYKIMGFSKTKQLDNPITINVCLAMPRNKEQIIFEPFSIKCGNDILEYHYLYFDLGNKPQIDTNLPISIK